MVWQGTYPQAGIFSRNNIKWKRYFSQLIYGSRNALAVGLSAALAVAILGTIVGLISGFYGGWIDNLIMRLADIALGLPFLPFVIC